MSLGPIDRKAACASPATALASFVLPHPGGPWSRIEAGAALIPTTTTKTTEECYLVMNEAELSLYSNAREANFTHAPVNTESAISGGSARGNSASSNRSFAWPCPMISRNDTPTTGGGGEESQPP